MNQVVRHASTGDTVAVCSDIAEVSSMPHLEEMK
jgi:hypothetical protein